MPRDSEFTGKIMVEAFKRAGRCCEACGAALVGGNRPQYDHIIPLSIGGDSTLDNVQVLCKTCHLAKSSKQDIPRTAKMKRQRAKHINAVTSSARPMPHGRNSPTKRLIGTHAVVDRATGERV